MHRIFTSRNNIAITLPGAILLIFIALAISMPGRVLADGGGGLPTRTPTATLIPLAPTATPTSKLFLSVPGTPTDAPQAGGGFLKYPLPSDQAAIAQAGAANAPKTNQGFSLLSCWPFAIVALILLILGVLWLSSRVRQGGNP